MKLKSLLAAALLFSGAHTFSQMARVQIIHNAPDTTVRRVDVWVDTMKVAAGLPFRQATPFLELPSTTLLTIRLAPAGSMDTSMAVYRQSVNLGAGQNYYVVANGVLDTAMYQPNPNMRSTRLHLDIVSDARDSSQLAGSLQFRFMHGIPDYDSLNIRITGQTNFLVQPQMFRDVSNLVTLPPALYDFSVYRGVSYDEVFTFQGLFANYADSSIFLVSSGLFQSVTDSVLPRLGVLAVLPSGIQAFYPGFVITSTKQALNAAGWSVYPNPAIGNNIQVKGPANLTTVAVVELIDAQGRSVSTQLLPMQNGQLNFERGSLSNGLYLLKVQAGNQLYSSRLKL